VIVAVVVAYTVEVETAKVADVAPAATVTEPGTVAARMLDDRLTNAPPSGAALLRMTVPVEEIPPTTDVGETLTPDKSGV